MLAYAGTLRLVPLLGDDSTLRLRFPLREVIMVVSVTLAASGSMWAVTYGLRSDVRDVLTRMDDQKTIEAEKAKLQDERMQNLRESIMDMKRRQELQQYEIQNLKEMILKGRAQ